MSATSFSAWDIELSSNENNYSTWIIDEGSNTPELRTYIEHHPKNIILGTDHAYYYVHDRLGSVRLMINYNGSTVNEYSYDLFGKVNIADIYETTDIDGNIIAENAFKFTGHWYDEEIGQYYARARMYDPDSRRFTSRDPYRGNNAEPMTLHRYLYCLNNPVNMTDPDGEFAHFAVAIFVGAVAGAAADIFLQVWDQLPDGGSIEIDWNQVGVMAAVGAAAGATGFVYAGGFAAAEGAGVAALIGVCETAVHSLIWSNVIGMNVALIEMVLDEVEDSGW